MCNESRKQANRIRRAAYKEQGLCRCGRVPDKGFKTCRRCLSRDKTRRESLTDSGKCQQCGRENGTDTIYCTECLTKRAFRLATGSVKGWEIVDELFTGVCALTGLPIERGVNAHLDHKLPKSGYPHAAKDPSNLQWLHEDINMMKRNLHPQVFLELCKKVVDFNQL